MERWIGALAFLHASAARDVMDSPWEMMCRWRMPAVGGIVEVYQHTEHGTEARPHVRADSPVLDAIHSSFVSTSFPRSSFVRTAAGTAEPTPGPRRRRVGGRVSENGASSMRIRCNVARPPRGAARHALLQPTEASEAGYSASRQPAIDA